MNAPVDTPKSLATIGSHQLDQPSLTSRSLLTEQLLGQLIAQQHDLTAVESFSSWHDAEHAHDQAYQALLPATAPGPGQQYAFEVNLDTCSGCKACVVACHTLNGLGETETW